MGGGRALERHIEPVAQRLNQARQHTGMLFHRDRLTRQGRLVHPELGDFYQTQVRRHLVAGFQQHNVARDQFARRHHLRLPAPHHGGLCGRQLLQGSHGLIGTPYLDKTNDGIEQHDHQDGHRVNHIAQDSRDHGGCDQHHNHEVLELV